MKESELCASFREAAEADGWTVYPEIAEWDLVLVWTGDAPVPEGAQTVQKGDQVAVEAKTRANVEALHQAATRSRYARRGAPDFRAVLAPKAGESFRQVAAMLGIGTFTLRHCGPWSYRRGPERERKIVVAPGKRWDVTKRLWLPPIVPTTEAGSPSPRPLTPWRVKALRLIIHARAQGYLTRLDFDAQGISPTVWTQQRWIVPAGRFGRRTRYRLDEDRPNFPSKGWEAELDALKATA